MAQQIELLNNETHRALSVRQDPGIPHPHFVPIALNEFPAAASTCPIFFAKDSATGEFYAAALFGFEPGEVLFEDNAKNGSIFQPLDMQRQGFFTADENIAVDVAHPRFGAGALIALFDADGEPTQAMRKIQSILGQLHAGLAATRTFIAELLRLKAIEPIDISLSFDDGKDIQLEGLYTVSRDTLNDLPDHEILALFRNGYLQAAMSMTFSLNQIAVLARRRNARLTASS
ncbi:SapC family protein [Sphingobium sp. CR28]|uniref:SapC family protein n=1 Tax=Sphingobium sp. CR28 TaxID=3400272 RepID=UPI003FF0D7C3